MSTEVLQVMDRGALGDELARAGRVLRAGGLVAFPTETVYGIAVSAERPEAVERLYALKGRDRKKPMTTMIADPSSVHARCPVISPTARAIMAKFWPGPLTLVLPDADGELAGFRVPSHPLALGLVRSAGVPLLVPSANRSGEAPATTAEQVLDAFPSELEMVIDGGDADEGVESTVVKVVDDDVVVLREGAIPEWRLRTPNAASVLFVCRGNTDRSPLAQVILIRRLCDRLGCAPEELESHGLQVMSAGISAREGRRASRKARRVAAQEFEPPIDLAGHRSRKLTEEMVASASRILCMEDEIREQILAFFPHRARDVFLLDPEGNDVDDPAGAPYPDYRRLARRLNAAAVLIAGTLAG